MMGEDFDRNVFVNCPYSPDYQEMLRAMIFVLLRLGFVPCIAAQRFLIGPGTSAIPAKSRPSPR